jgi:hypothetical protein
MFTTSLFFAYLAPETVFPFTSVIAGALGVVMIFGRRAARSIIGRLRRTRLVRSLGKGIADPHFRTGARRSEKSSAANR